MSRVSRSDGALPTTSERTSDMLDGRAGSACESTSESERCMFDAAAAEPLRWKTALSWPTSSSRTDATRT